MNDNLFEALFKFLDEPITGRRIVTLLILLSFLTVGLLSYERYTFSLRLSRLQKEAELLSHLQELNHATNQAPQFERSRQALADETEKVIKASSVYVEEIPSKLGFLAKFFAGAALWIVFAIFPISRWKTESGRKEGMWFLAIAALSGFGAIFVPAIWWPWFHIIFYPLIFFTTLLMVVTPFALVPALKKAKTRAQTVSCSNNLKQIGLGARVWAGDHNNAFPKDFDSMRAEIGDARITLCPSSSCPYEILSPGISDNDPQVVYARCPTHNAVLLADGNVQLVAANQLVKHEGKWKITPPLEAK